jgi:hypothetical protein
MAGVLRGGQMQVPQIAQEQQIRLGPAVHRPNGRVADAWVHVEVEVAFPGGFRQALSVVPGPVGEIRGDVVDVVLRAVASAVVVRRSARCSSP